MNQTRRRNSRKPSSTNNTFDSQGPEGKIRGTAHQIFEKYMSLARDANLSGDRVAAESFYQFADHYFRLMTPENENEGNTWRDDTPRSSKRTFQQSSFISEGEAPIVSPSSNERIENASPKGRSPNDRPTGGRERFETRRSRHPYLGGGNSRSYGERQNRPEQQPVANSEAISTETSASPSPENPQDVITVIQ